MADEETEQPQKTEENESEQMCCDGKRTAADHRKDSPDGKCCSDSSAT